MIRTAKSKSLPTSVLKCIHTDSDRNHSIIISSEDDSMPIFGAFFEAMKACLIFVAFIHFKVLNKVDYRLEEYIEAAIKNNFQ